VDGIDMPSRTELIATGRSDEEICREISADRLFYQDIEDLKAAVTKANPALSGFDCSCFDGRYITGDITPEYLDAIEAARGAGKANKTPDDDQLELDLAMSASSM
jgi:amidophosphoribosyltransferase